MCKKRRCKLPLKLLEVCQPLANRNNKSHNTMKPNEAIIAGLGPFVMRGCKYEANTSQVINAQVPFGSQLQ